jgi:hypothetical protein
MTLLALTLVLALQGSTAQPAGGSLSVTWTFEAPEMGDEAEFNETGEIQVPIRYEPKECEATVAVVNIHTFQYIKGSTRGRDRMPSTSSSGAVVRLAKRQDTISHPLQVTVRVEGGRGDVSGDQSFALPLLSSSQWRDMDASTSWVFPGEVNMLPKFLNRVVVSCR